MSIPEECVDGEDAEPEESSGLHEVSLPGHHLAQPGGAHVIQAEEVAHLVQQQLFREVSKVGLVVAHVQAEAILYLQEERKLLKQKLTKCCANFKWMFYDTSTYVFR